MSRQKLRKSNDNGEQKRSQSPHDSKPKPIESVPNKSLSQKVTTPSTTVVPNLDEHTSKVLKVKQLVEQRDLARAQENFMRSDELRDELQLLGVKVQDQKVSRTNKFVK